MKITSEIMTLTSWNTYHRATNLVPGKLIEVQLENGASVKSRTVIVATGASWRKMQVPGEEKYIGRGIAFCPHCDGPLYKNKKNCRHWRRQFGRRGGD